MLTRRVSELGKANYIGCTRGVSAGQVTSGQVAHARVGR